MEDVHRTLTRYVPKAKKLIDIHYGENIPYDDPRYTCTKFGGLQPFFNPGAQWPLCQFCMRPQTFIGQINLEDRKVPLPIRERLASHGGEGIFQIFWCLDDYLLTNPSRTHRKEGFSASFVMPKLNSPRSPPSLVDLAARRIANEIIQENPPAALDNHEMLTDLPEHLQTITKSLVLETRAERAATKQREYCVDALKDISRFAVFDPRAVAKDSPPWPEGFVKRVEELSRNNGWNLGGGGGWGWGGIRNAKILYPPEHTFYDWRESESHYEDLDLGSDTISEVGVDSPSSRDPKYTENGDCNDYVRKLLNGYTFMGWPQWMNGGDYPICPTNSDHGLCFDLVLMSHIGGVFSPELEDGWFNLLKCPKCSSFVVTLQSYD